MSSFNLTAYVKSWLAAGRHAATDMGKTWKEKEVTELDPSKLQLGK